MSDEREPRGGRPQEPAGAGDVRGEHDPASAEALAERTRTDAASAPAARPRRSGGDLSA